MAGATTGDITDLDVETLSPGDVEPDRLRAALAHEEGLVRDHAADICRAFAAEDAEAVLPLLPSLSEALADDNVNVVLKAVTTVDLVAEERPAELDGAVGALCALLTHDLPRVQLFAGKVVRTLGPERPEWFTPHAEALLAAFRSGIDDPTDGVGALDGIAGDASLRQQFDDVRRSAAFQQYTVQAVAGNLLVEVADREPRAVVPLVEDVLELLSVEDPNAAAIAAEVVGNVAASNPDAVERAVGPLCDRLDGTSEVVVARATTALGQLGDPRAAEPLREVASDDARSEDLRDLAAETAEWLETGA